MAADRKDGYSVKDRLQSAWRNGCDDAQAHKPYNNTYWADEAMSYERGHRAAMEDMCGEQG